MLALAVLVIVAFVQLGRWQLGVAQDKATQDLLDQAARTPVVELSSVLQPHVPFPGELSARPVRVSGSYAAADQVLIANRRLGDELGFWVVSGLRTSDGAVVPVLRGFVTEAGAAGPPPTGSVTVEGALAPGESPVRSDPLPPGQLPSLDLAVLVNEWSGDLYNGFIFLTAQTPGPGADPADPATLTGLTLVPPPQNSGGLSWRNASYAAQWWVFAAFVLWLWWRMVRDEHRRERGEGSARHTRGVGDDPAGEPADAASRER